jgi:hypothetical protein
MSLLYAGYISQQTTDPASFVINFLPGCVSGWHTMRETLLGSSALGVRVPLAACECYQSGDVIHLWMWQDRLLAAASQDPAKDNHASVWTSHFA